MVDGRGGVLQSRLERRSNSASLHWVVFPRVGKSKAYDLRAAAYEARGGLDKQRVHLAWGDPQRYECTLRCGRNGSEDTHREDV